MSEIEINADGGGRRLAHTLDMARPAHPPVKFHRIHLPAFSSFASGVKVAEFYPAMVRPSDRFRGPLSIRRSHAIDRDAVDAYIEHLVGPDLRPGDIVIMDNLSGHKGPKVRQLIEAAGASLLYLPPYSPDFNCIEMAFAKLKALLRKAAERTVDGLWIAIGRLIDLFTPDEGRNDFEAAEYDPK